MRNTVGEPDALSMFFTDIASAKDGASRIL